MIEMRAPCRSCGSMRGVVEEKSGQDVVRCADCDSWVYNRPKAESGKEVRSVRTRPQLKPSVRHRILERDGHRCLSCGRPAPDVILVVDHFLPLGHPLAEGLSEEEVWSDWNLLTLCEACNLGKSDSIPAIPTVFAALLRHFRSAA